MAKKKAATVLRTLRKGDYIFDMLLTLARQGVCDDSVTKTDIVENAPHAFTSSGRSYALSQLVYLRAGVWVTNVHAAAMEMAHQRNRADELARRLAKYEPPFSKTPTEPTWGTVVIDDASLGKTQELTCKAAALYTVTGVCGDPTDNDRLVTLTHVELDGGVIERNVRMSTGQLKYDENRRMWVYFDKPEVTLPNVGDRVINGDMVVDASKGLCDPGGAVMTVKSVTRGSPTNSPSIVFESCSPAIPDLTLSGGEVTSKTIVYSKKSDIWFIWPSRGEIKPASIPTKTKITDARLHRRGWRPSINADGGLVHPNHPGYRITFSADDQYVFLQGHMGDTTRVDTMEELDRIFPNSAPPVQQPANDPRRAAVSMYEAQPRPK